MILNKDTILGALPALSQVDLAAIHAVAGQLLGAATGRSKNQPTVDSSLFFDALGAALGQPVFGFNPTIRLRFDKALPALTSFLDTDFKGWDANKVGQIAFLRMLFNLLVKDLKERGVPPTLGIIVNNMPRIPEVFDAAFPGYRESGIAAEMILKHFK